MDNIQYYGVQQGSKKPISRIEHLLLALKRQCNINAEILHNRTHNIDQTENNCDCGNIQRRSTLHATFHDAFHA